MKNILLIGAGKSATSLIEYLVQQGRFFDWQLTVADSNLALARSKTGHAGEDRARAVELHIEDQVARELLISKADLVISLMPPALHILVAGSCLATGKNLLTASYLDDPLKKLEPSIRERGLLFLCEMGLDPGIDHMSAMQLINTLKQGEKKILSFRSHTGGLVAPENDDNPWHYKISWNPRNVVMAGSAGAKYKEEGRIINQAYEGLFENAREINFPGIGRLAWYPNRDSLAYIPVYGLEEADTFIRTTLRYPVFCEAWDALVKAGLTRDKDPVRDMTTISEWSSPLKAFINHANKPLFDYLGLFGQEALPTAAKSSADILQHLLEKKLVMQSGDRDMIVMMHELEYAGRTGPDGPPKKQRLSSSLMVKGSDPLHTAMAQTVGWPLGIAAKLILQGNLRLKGLHIPILPVIYEPVLEELATLGVRFQESLAG